MANLIYRAIVRFEQRTLQNAAAGEKLELNLAAKSATGSDQHADRCPLVVFYLVVATEHAAQRVPLDWAMTQNNLGASLQSLGERESGTARLEEAVQAYRVALEECTPERVPHYWDVVQGNLAEVLELLRQRRGEPDDPDAAIEA